MQNVAPIILVNVLDPATHKTALTAETLPVVDHQAKVEETGILKSGLVLKLNSESASPMVEITDYTLSFDENGYLVITLTASGAAGSASTIYLSAGYKIDPTAVDYEDIIGTASGNTETGLQLIRQIYPLFGMTPGLLVAPGWSHYPSVAAAMQAKCEEINGCFSCECLIDIATVSGITEGQTDVPYASEYADVRTAKESLGASSPHAMACWPMAKVGSKTYYLQEKITGTEGQVVMINSSGNAEAQTKDFGLKPRIRVTVESGALVTVTNGTQSYRQLSTGDVLSFDVDDYGTWTASAKKSGKTSNSVVTLVDTVQIYDVTLTFFASTITVTVTSGSKSVTGSSPETSITRGRARSSIHNLGSTYWQQFSGNLH